MLVECAISHVLQATTIRESGLNMARTNRVTVFLSDDEMDAIQAVTPNGIKLPNIIRCMALDSIQWSLANGRYWSPKPKDGAIPARQKTTQTSWEKALETVKQNQAANSNTDGEYTLDRSNSQE